MANNYQNRTNTRIPRAIGVTTIVFGAVYVILAMMLLSYVDLSNDYARPILDKLDELSGEELVTMAIVCDISLAVAGLFGIIFGYGILRMKKLGMASKRDLQCHFHIAVRRRICAEDAIARLVPCRSEHRVACHAADASTQAYFRPVQITQK